MSETKTNYVGGRPIDYSTSVAVSGVPNVHQVYTDLGRYATGGYVINDHTSQDLHIYISNDGVTYSMGKYTSSGSLPSGAVAYSIVKPKEGFNLSGLQIHTLKIDASGNNTMYRVFAF